MELDLGEGLKAMQFWSPVVELLSFSSLARFEEKKGN